MATFFTGEALTITRPFLPWFRWIKNPTKFLPKTNQNYNHNHEANPALVQVQNLEAEKLEEMLTNPETASAKNLLLAISREIFNPEMAAFASSLNTLAKRLQRRLTEMITVPATDID